MGTVDFQTATHGQSQAVRQKRPDPAAGVGKILSDPDGAFRQITATLLTEETGKVMKHLTACLPKEALAGLKDTLNNYFERSFHAIFNRCLETDYENRNNILTGQTPREIAELLHSFGGADAFNTGRIEKNTAVRTAMQNLELHTGNVLRLHYFAGSFPAGDGICKIAKYLLKDNVRKPGTVADLRFCINIPVSDLISPVFYDFALARYIIKEQIARPLIDTINREIESMAGCENFNAAEFLEKITESGAEDEKRININEHPAIAAILAKGFGNAVNAFTSILDDSHLDFQFMESLKDKNHVTIREYERHDEAPDEHYEITLMLLDNTRLDEARTAFDAQVLNFEKAVQHLGKLFEVLYHDSKSVFKVNDFDDLALKNKSRVKKLFGSGYVTGKEWNTITFRSKNHYERGNALSCLARLRERINSMYEYLYPVERRVMEERLDLLEKEFVRLDNMTDPSHLQPGLVIDLAVTSIKRKRITLDAMAAVLQKFLGGLPEIFQSATLPATK